MLLVTLGVHATEGLTSSAFASETQHWIDKFYIVENITGPANIKTSLKTQRQSEDPTTDIGDSPIYLGYVPSTKTCNFILRTKANFVLSQIFAKYSLEEREVLRLALMIHELGHCFDYVTSVGLPVHDNPSGSEALADVFAISYIAIVLPNQYQLVVRFFTDIRTNFNGDTEHRYDTLPWLAQSEKIQALSKVHDPLEIANHLVRGAALPK